jgi:hypothetical protein
MPVPDMPLQNIQVLTKHLPCYVTCYNMRAGHLLHGSANRRASAARRQNESCRGSTADGCYRSF